MNQTTTTLPAIKLVGITARTRNADEINQTTAKIGPLVGRYLDEQIAHKIPNRANAGTSYSVFTDYESDHNGFYTYFIGEEVSSFKDLPEGFSSLTIPAQTYAKFTNGPAPMPGVCVDIWKKVWSMSAEQLGGQRAYKADFELYDTRAADWRNVTLDVFIGLKS